MKKEKNIIFLGMFINLVIASIKILTGITFNLSILIADSLQTITDFITDIISIIATKIGKKKANKRYPFGYGMAENIANLFIGILLILVSIYIFITSFNHKEIYLHPIVFIILISCIILKTITILIIYYNGKKLNSNTLISSVKESILDLSASITILIICILLLFKDKHNILEYSNTIGGILISIMVFYTTIKIIIENTRYLLGINEDNEEITNKINEIIKENKLIKDSNIKLMKIGTYYNLYLIIELETSVTLKQLFSLETKLKKQIKNKKLNIKFISIEPKKYD